MSYAICRIMKFKVHDVSGLQIHHRREKEGLSHTNQDIDWSRTKDNINLLNRDYFVNKNVLEDKTNSVYRQIISKRIGELNLKNRPRKDATAMVDFLITSDPIFFDKMSRKLQIEFFERSFEFIRDRYGSENIIDANIHFDEKTPHMHMEIVPVTPDGRLCAKDLFTPRSLKTLQTDFAIHCQREGYDLKRGECSELKKEHLSLEEFKLKTKEQELSKKEKKLKKVEKKVTRLEELNNSYTPSIETKKIYTSHDVEKLVDQNQSLRIKYRNLEDKVKTLSQDALKSSENLNKANKDFEEYKVLVSDYNRLEYSKTALNDHVEKNVQLQQILEPFQNRISKLFEDIDTMNKLKSGYQEYSKNLRNSQEELSQVNYEFRSVDLKYNNLVKDKEYIDTLKLDLEKNTQKKEGLGFFQGLKSKVKDSVNVSLKATEESLKYRLETIRYKYSIKSYEEIQPEIDRLYEKCELLKSRAEMLIDENQKLDDLKQETKTWYQIFEIEKELYRTPKEKDLIKKELKGPDLYELNPKNIKKMDREKVLKKAPEFKDFFIKLDCKSKNINHSLTQTLER